MTDYRTIDWTQIRPTSAEWESGWRESHILDIGTLDSRLAAVVDNLNHTHGNGGARAAQFRLEAHPAIRWFLVRNRLTEVDFFRKFFQHDVVHRRLMAPSASYTDGDLGFSLDEPFVASGRLAQIISNGGAYRRFEGCDADVLVLVHDFMQATFENRYSEARTYLSWKPWSSWFQDVAWDASFFWLDPRTGTTTVLVVTDTD